MAWFVQGLGSKRVVCMQGGGHKGASLLCLARDADALLRGGTHCWSWP